MTTRRLALSILLLGCVSLAAGPVVGQLNTVDTAAQIELNGPATVKPGETVTIRVDVATTRPLYAVQFGLSINRTTLTPTAVEKGDFLARDAQSVIVADEASDRNVSYGETRVGVDTGVNGTGTLATVTFSVAEDATNGAVGLGLHSVKLVTPAAEPITTSMRNLTVAIDKSSGGSSGDGGQPGEGTQGDVEVTNLSLLNTSVTTDAVVVTRVDLANFDPAEGRLTLTLTANGSVVTERTLSVGASSRRTVDLRHRFRQPGTYGLRVNGSPVGAVTVTAADTPTPTPTTAPTDALTETPTARPPDTPTSGGPETPTGTATPAGPSTTTAGDGAGFGISSVVVAAGLLLVRYARN